MSIFRSSFFFSLGTILSRLSGLIRESILAGVFGASVYFDAFLVAFRIPNLLRDMLAEGALSGAFTRVYTSTYERSPKAAGELFYDSLRVFFVLSLLIVSLGIFLSPELVKLMTVIGNYNANEDFYLNAVVLTRIIFPFIMFPILGSIAMGVLHRHNGFFITGISPVLLNIGFIIGAVGFARMNGWSEWLGLSSSHYSNDVIGLAMGVLLGGAAQFFFQLVFAIRRVTGAIKCSRQWFGPDLKKVFILMAPAAIAASAGPVSAFVNTNFATSVGEGAVSWLYYSFRLLQLPVGVFGVAIGMAALPALTRSITQANGKVDQMASDQLQKCIQIVLWLMVPAFLVLYFAAEPFINLFFKHARFSAEDAIATKNALKAYSFGVVGYGLIKVLTSYYFSIERTRYAMMVSLCGICLTVMANYLLVDDFGHVGLAYAASITLTANAVFLMLGTKKDKVLWRIPKLLRGLSGILLASLVFVVSEYFLGSAISAIDLGVGKVNALTQLILHIGLLSLIFIIAILVVEKKSPIRLLRS